MMDEADAVALTLTVEEIRILQTALELLEDTLGREEAEELEEVQALLARLRVVSAGGHG